MTEKIRIISCTKHRKKHYDYSELIGKEFNVKSEGSKYYILEGVKGVILKSDCQAIALLTGKQLTEGDLIVGNRFECIEDLSTYKTGTIYTKGKVYECNKDGFITNDYTERNWFMPIEEINRHFKLLPTQESVKERNGDPSMYDMIQLVEQLESDKFHLQQELNTLTSEIKRFQEKYDENGYDCSNEIKLLRIENHIDFTLSFYHKEVTDLQHQLKQAKEMIIQLNEIIENRASPDMINGI